MDKKKLIQFASVFAILIIPSLFYVILTSGEHDIARLSFYEPGKTVDPVPGKDDSIAHFSVDSETELVTITGDTITFKSLQGNILVAHFFCTDCDNASHRVLTQMHELALKFADKPDVKILSIACDSRMDSFDVIAEFSKKFKDTPESHMMVSMVNDERTFAKESLLLPEYGVYNEDAFISPTIVVLDKLGRPRAYHDGMQYLEKSAVDDAIEALRFAYYRDENMTKKK